MIITKVYAVVFSAVIATASAGITATAMIIIRPAVAPLSVSLPAPRTVSYFEAHQDEMHAKRDFCRDNPGLAEHDPECASSDDAATSVSADQFLSILNKKE